mgnify:CR=1 FL=1
MVSLEEIDKCSSAGQYLVEIFKIGFIVFFFFLVTMLILIVQYKSYIQDNWNQYRCNPLIIPFSSYFGYDSSETFNYCITQSFNAQGLELLKPIGFSTGLIGDILNSITNSIQDIRGFFNTFRNLFLKFVEGIMKRIEDSASTLQYLFTKMKSIIERLWGIMVTMIYTGYTTVETMTSVFTGPIGGMAKFFCFDENTPIQLYNHKYKTIKDIKIGDKILGGGNVLGILKFISNNHMYLYNNKITVSGSHLVYENNKWIRIENSQYSKYINHYNKPYIYCLITQHNIITSIDNIVFKDFIETNSFSKNLYIKYIILNKLNQNDDLNLFNFQDFQTKLINNNNKNILDYYETGFGKDTIIKMDNNIGKKIKDIKIGDTLDNGLKVIGIIKQYCHHYYIYKDKIKIAGNQIIYDKINKKWILLKNIMNNNNNEIVFINRPILLYHLCIENNGNLNIDNVLLSRDYQEIDEKMISNRIHNLILT